MFINHSKMIEKQGQCLVEQSILLIGTTALHIRLLILGGSYTQTPPQTQVGTVCAESVIFQVEVLTFFNPPCARPWFSIFSLEIPASNHPRA